MVAGPANVIYLSSILGRDGPIPGHKCDWKCENEHVCGNMYRCKLTGLTHICDKNCNQRILYDNHSSLCRASRKIFPLTPTEEQAVRGVRRKLDAENSPSDSCGGFKRRRDAQINPSPFERSFSAVSPICSQVGDGMDMSQILIITQKDSNNFLSFWTFFPFTIGQVTELDLLWTTYCWTLRVRLLQELLIFLVYM